MLPETSSITISRIGCGELSKRVIGCGLPSSRISKSFCVERGDETAVTIGDGDEDADGVAGAAKRRLLLSGRAKCRAYTRGEDCQT